MPRYRFTPTPDPRTFRVYAGRRLLGQVVKRPEGWLPEGGVPTDYRATKEAAAERLCALLGRTRTKENEHADAE